MLAIRCAKLAEMMGYGQLFQRFGHGSESSARVASMLRRWTVSAQVTEVKQL